jgi:hypothetical protein
MSVEEVNINDEQDYEVQFHSFTEYYYYFNLICNWYYVQEHYKLISDSQDVFPQLNEFMKDQKNSKNYDQFSSNNKWNDLLYKDRYIHYIYYIIKKAKLLKWNWSY